MNDDLRQPGGDIAFLSGGEMGVLMREHDWAATPLGSPSSWPQSLRTSLSIGLNSQAVTCIYWGSELRLLYNDAHIPVLADRHPWALGRPMAEVWPDIAGVIGPQFVSVMETGRGFAVENQPLRLVRHGREEETYWFYSFSPIRDESGGVGGIFATAVETTAQVRAERRLVGERERMAQMFQQAPGFMALLRGPEHVFELVNAAYMQLIGHRDVVGRPVREVLPDVKGQGFFELLDQVFATGEPFVGRSMPVSLQQRPGAPVERRFVDLVFQPTRTADGAVTGIFLQGSDVTERHASSVRQGFRLSLEERLRDLADPEEVIAAASRALGRHLGVGQVAYAEVEPGDEFVTVLREWNDGTVASNVGRHRLEDYGPDLIANLRSGRTIAIGDVRLDARTNSAQALAAFAQASIAGLLNVPLVKAGRLVAILGVHSATPRDWSADEVTIAEEIASRTWAAAERARAEAAIRDSEKRRATALAAARLGTFEWDLGTDAVTLDDRSREIFGLLPHEGRHAQDVIGRVHPDDLSRVMADVQASAEALSRMATEYRIVWPDGSVRMVASLGEMVPGATGQAERVVGVFDDITERKGIEAALRDSEARLRASNADLERQVVERSHERGLMWQHSPDLFAIMSLDDGTLDRVNPAWTGVLGWTPEEIEGRPYHEFVHPDDLPRSAGALEDVQAGNPLLRFENRYRHKDGSWRWLSTVALPEGRRIYSTSRDITAEKERDADLLQAQEQLRQSQKMEAMGQLTGGVAHDFNNLLTPIIASLDMLLRRGVGSERERRLMDGALQSAERARVLVQRLLAFARRQPLQPGPVDIRSLVSGMAELIASTSGPRIDVRVEMPSDLPPALADANQLEMAVLNLAVNARDAMPDAGVLTISATRESVKGRHAAKLRPGHYICLSVKDTGVGMDEATLARAVEPFFSTKGVGKGTGLGLSMVHGLTEQLGGGMTITSCPGHGTTVSLWLPLSAVAAEEDRQASGLAKPPEAQGTALLVDDEDLVRLSTADMLMDLGYEVVEASSAEEALRLVEDGLAPDLVVTDHLMPGLTGLDLARDLRSRRPDLPVLIVSGYAQMDGIAPGFPRLTKPFRAAELAASLADLTPETGT